MKPRRTWISKRDGGSVTIEHSTIHGTTRTTVAGAMELDADDEKARLQAFAAELRKWWRFDQQQAHTHSWHDREDFIEKVLPQLLAGQLPVGGS